MTSTPHNVESANGHAELSRTEMPQRSRLPATRNSVTHKFSIDGHEGYMTVGLFEDGRPGELFIKMAKEGSTMSGLMDTIGILTSMALQHGVPVHTLAQKFEHMRFEPSGLAKHPDIRHADSLPASFNLDEVIRAMEEAGKGAN